MPDIRLRPGQPSPTDVGLGRGEPVRQDVVLRPGAAPDVALSRGTGFTLPAGGESHAGSALCVVACSAAGTGAKATTSASGTLPATPALASAGTTTRSGAAGALAISAGTAQTGKRSASGSGTVSVPSTLSAAGGRKGARGSASLSLVAGLDAASPGRGSAGVPTRTHWNDRRPLLRPEPRHVFRRQGDGSLALACAMAARGYRVEFDDEELYAILEAA